MAMLGLTQNCRNRVVAPGRTCVLPSGLTLNPSPESGEGWGLKALL
jgi:hypothetical protein